jgi:hypothetical protein
MFEDGIEYFDFYFEISSFKWNIEIWEKDKCSDLVYKSITDIDSIKVLTHDIIAINNINKKLTFSELLLKDSEY